MRQYGTEGIDAGPSGLHKSKSWSSGMNVTDNDSETILENEDVGKELIPDEVMEPDSER